MNVYSSGQDLVDVFALNDPEVSDMQEYSQESSITYTRTLKSNMNIFTQSWRRSKRFCAMEFHIMMFFSMKSERTMKWKISLVPPTPQQKEREMIEATLGLNNMSENSDALNRKTKKKKTAKNGKMNKISKHRVDKFGLLRRRPRR